MQLYPPSGTLFPMMTVAQTLKAQAAAKRREIAQRPPEERDRTSAQILARAAQWAARHLPRKEVVSETPWMPPRRTIDELGGADPRLPTGDRD